MQIKKNEEKFIEVYNLYIDEIYKFAYLRTGYDKQQAEDITQEIFMDVYKGLSGFKGLCSQKTWIYKICRNKINDYYRKQYKLAMNSTDIEELESSIDNSMDVEMEIIDKYDKKLILNCLNLIPKQYKLLLTLKYIDDLSIKKIAEVLDKSNKSVESMITRARKAYMKQYLLLQEDNKDEEKH